MKLRHLSKLEIPELNEEDTLAVLTKSRIIKNKKTLKYIEWVFTNRFILLKFPLQKTNTYLEFV
jgi:hypothetical protein